MLQSLSIRNVVLIDKLDLDFKSGLSVLTGETGAGKSILLDSLGLVLGNRAETSLIRQGEDKLSVTAQFSLQKQTPALRALLDEYEIEADDELLIKRSLTRDGKGKIFINEVNTMPGFTPFSMFPSLWANMNVTYPEIIEELFDLALERYEDRKNLLTEE